MRAVWLAGVLSLACAGAQAAEPTPQQIDDLTDAVVQLLPLGQVMESAAAADPHWPVQGKVDAVTPEQLVCLRKEMSTDGFRRYKRTEVADYLRNHNGNLQDELRVTRQSGPVMSRIMLAGAAAEGSKEKVDLTTIMREANADQLLAMVSLARDPKYRDLRELTGMGDAMSGEGSAKDNHAVGELIAIKAMFHGFKMCNVAPGALM